MIRVYVPASGVLDWKARLAEPEKHWKAGRSAHSLAHAWQTSASDVPSGFPRDVAAVLDADPALSELELLLALPEHQVPLPGGSRPSQTDIWLLARSSSELISIAVEGKVDESFGPTLSEWTDGASEGKRKRLAFMQNLIGLTGELPGTTRYQLIHRTASAVIEAKRFLAPRAVMLVHSFGERDASLSDYQAFLGLFGVAGAVNQVVAAGVRSGVHLHFGWVRSAFPGAEAKQ